VSSWKLGFSVVVLVVLASRASATSPVYHCTKDGQTVLTDTPCDASTAASSLEPAGSQTSAPDSIVGQWRGQTQFQGAEEGRELQEVHSVVPLVLTFSADGKVSGVSADNGCTLLGLWAPGVTPRLFTLDITLSDCRYAGFNRRYSGTVTTAQIDQSARLELMVYTVPIPGIPIRRYDVGATLRR
jgi:Domain of unknown function (DUF4124)